ncbi:hypothetical protein AMS68_003699 [Peltaster fructicola]|uniref:Uncharacterized protein n=1 Tax=Peltaster fructicola TaxID=286661 RepID=A0A6H0XTT3_9PEZI|nr:hypothetical protein AMS68_003699 [Peltaster fructicola]
MPSSPVRKFAPTPVETTTRSSTQKDAKPIDQSQAKPRRFVPETVETSVRSSRDARPNTPETGDLHTLKQEHKTRRFAPEPVETTARSSKDKKETGDKPKPRRFAVQPVETTTRSSKDGKDNEDKPKPRRFAVQPVETTHKSSKDKHEDVPQIKFTPQLVETTYSNSRQSCTDTTKSVRKFAPVLIDTARRSRKAGDVKSVMEHEDKTEQGFSIAAREHRRHITGTATPMEVDDEHYGKGGPLDLMAIDEAELRPISPFDGSSRRARSQQRQHSFRCPDLDTIESSESDRESDTSSLPPDVVQGSPITASDSSFNEYKHATRIRESIDENFANYFLQLEAKRAQKRLREQALAAFPNSDFHEPVEHYVNEERDSDSDESIDYRPVTYDEDEDNSNAKAVRRESTKVPWEQLEMQRHAERLDQERKANQVTAAPTGGPWWNEYDVEPDAEMESMRDRARPPMLGSDLTFTRCSSPEPARFDVTQGSTALRNQMCYLTEHAESQSKSDETPALWGGGPTVKHADSVQSTVTSGSTASKGLWGGFCAGDPKKSLGGLAVPSVPSGLITPRQESLNPFEQSFSFPHSVEMSGVVVHTPPTPADSDGPSHPHTIDGVLGAERDFEDLIEQEFPDSFVTQVYNYLSLGYPSLARPYDEELAKIAHIPISDLRQDDQKARATPRGYIRLGQDFEGGGGVESEESCRRWVALKSYIREWARQEKTTVNFDGPAGNFATTARRGSWGI